MNGYGNNYQIAGTILLCTKFVLQIINSFITLQIINSFIILMDLRSREIKWK